VIALLLEKKPRAPGHVAPEAAPASDERVDVERVVRCARCDHTLARARDRVAVNGAHTHTFVNPSGEEFTIGCFSDAAGAVGYGAIETFFSWFSGHAWRVALCGACAAHVGWSFHGNGVFFGLIVDRVAD